MVTIGSVSYLNARPLVEWFKETDEGRATGVKVVEYVPSRLLTPLQKGEIACALLSSVTYFQNPGWGYVPEIAIASDGPVESVCLFTEKAISDIRTIALDTSSLTSVNLLKIILREKYNLTPEFLPMAPHLTTMLTSADAALLIGDNGFRRNAPPHMMVLDLGAEWKSLTGLPFVYALWLGPKETLTPKLCALLQKAKAWGTANVAQIAEVTAAQHGKTVEVAIYYMTEAIRYDLTADAERGLQLFGQKLKEHNLL